MADKACFYRSFCGEPYYNMGFDEWLLARVIDSPNSLFLRLYTWSRGAITFGYNQRRLSALDFSQAGDTTVIRRITGGRALYHDQSEYTYAIALNTQSSIVEKQEGSVKGLSNSLSEALSAFLAALGIESSLVRKASRSDSHSDFFHKAPCFASAARHELLTGGRKIVASAQRRVGNGILQHGAIKIDGVAPHAALGDDVTPDASGLQPVGLKLFSETAEKFRDAMGAALRIRLVESALSVREKAAVLDHARYVEKSALDKRVIVKQMKGFVSL
jgi:lipoate-protein ligase A